MKCLQCGQRLACSHLAHVEDERCPEQAEVVLRHVEQFAKTGRHEPAK